MDANTQDSKRTYREPLTIYHPTSKKNGSAFRLDPSLNRREGRSPCFFLEMAQQKAGEQAGGRGRGHASFDWENKITVKLGFPDICEFLAVLEGVKEQAGDPGKGLYHRSGNANTMIRFERHESGGIAVALSRKREGQSEPSRVWTVLSAVEAIGIRHILGMGLFFMVAEAPIEPDLA